MFWRKKSESSETKNEKLPGPKSIPDQVGGHLVTEFNRNPDWVWRLKAVVRKRQESKSAFDVRVYDDAEAATKKMKVQDYTSLDEHSELILYEGWFDKESRQIEIEEKRAA